MASKRILYDSIENIKPENYEALKTDIEERTGLQIEKLAIGDIDFQKNSCRVTIKYYKD